MLTFIKEFWLGISSYWKALKFINEHKLYWYFLIPAGFMLIIYYLGNSILNYKIAADLTNMNGIVWYFIQVALNISIALLLMKFTKYIVVILLSPLLSHLSQRCEKIVTGNTYSTNYKQIIKDVKRGVRLAIRNIIWEYSFFLLIIIIAWIGWGDPFRSPLLYLTFIIGFYYYGFGFIDYDNERRKMDEQESISFVRSHRGLAMGIGMVYSFLILVPINLEILFSITELKKYGFLHIFSILFQFVLWVCASIAPILAIVSASIAMIKIKSKNGDEILAKNLIES
ncbi:MAG: EI24 domain-containing protein [Crocinitomicaceae bacterium]|nr:EI24 domain-containing protein [Crocinitomicaceae bacterium]